jgi:prefoldin subunit 5
MGATTSLEVIAQKLEEKKKQELEDILRVSGSAAITKNEYGITVVDDNVTASSLIFKPLTKSKYDNTELVKAIDVEVKELKPNIPVLNRDLVPKPLYDEQVTINADLTNQIAGLNIQIDTLNSTINELQSQVETETNNRLNIEQTNDALSNQLNTLTSTVEDFTKQIQSAIQKSVDESILRASLQAQNVGYKAQVEALIKQIDSLNSIIEGLQAQLGAVQQQQTIQNATQNIAFASGGDVVNDVVIAKLDPKTPDNLIKGVINNKNNASRWEGGQTMEFTNNDKVPVNVSLIIQNPGGQNWLVSPKTQFTIQPEKTETIAFGLNVGGCSYGKRDRSTGYDGKLTVKVKRGDGSEKQKDWNTRIDIRHPKSYD